MEILKEFGINPVLLIAQIINFLIILYVLKRFLYKPVLTTLQNRQKQIKTSLDQVEEARQLLEKASDREKEMLKRAQTEAKKMLEETLTQKNQIIAEAETAAKDQTKKIISDAKKQIELETKEAQRKLTIEASGMVVEFLQKSIAQIFNEEDQQKVIKKALEKIKKRSD